MYDSVELTDEDEKALDEAWAQITMEDAEKAEKALEQQDKPAADEDAAVEDDR